MTCVELKDLILDEMDGRLGEEQRQMLEIHVAGCLDCGQFRKAQLELDRSLAELARVDLSPQFTARVLGVSDGSRRHRSLVGYLEVLGLAAAAAASAIGTEFVLPRVGSDLPWVVAAVVMCFGTWLTLTEPASEAGR